MRSFGLFLLLVGVLAYLLPYYRQILPMDVPIDPSTGNNLAAAAVIVGLVSLVWSRP